MMYIVAAVGNTGVCAKAAICTVSSYITYWRCHDTVHQCINAVIPAFRSLQSDHCLQRYPRITGYSNPCVRSPSYRDCCADTSNPHAITTHTATLARGMPSGCDSGVILTTAESMIVALRANLTAKWSLRFRSIFA